MIESLFVRPYYYGDAFLVTMYQESKIAHD